MAAHTGIDKANAEHAVLHSRKGVGRVLTTCLAVGEHITERTVNIRERLDKAFIMACTDAGKPRAGIEQIVCTGGQPLTSSAESSSIAPQRWNLPMYEPSPPPIIPNFSINNYSLHFTYQSLRPLPFLRSVMRSLHPRCSRLQSRPCCPDLRSAQCRADG